MSSLDPLEGLNPQQRDAATASRGRVVILAGAGTGKTTTITHRIAYQVLSGAFPPESILAVAFTRKAQAEMERRLLQLGVRGVNVRTFHATALRQTRAYFEGKGLPMPVVLGSLERDRLIHRILLKEMPESASIFRKDAIAVIERAKRLGISPEGLTRAARDWVLPLELSEMATLYGSYERERRAAGQIDFEDMVDLALEAFRTDQKFAARIRERLAAVTVDEFQDVDANQVRLIEAWLGDRDEICVVGDDFQSIYGFRGGSPHHLLDWTRRYPQARVVTLETNYRSTPEILRLANRLVPRLGGAPKSLRPTRGSGPEPRQVTQPTPEDETTYVPAIAKRLHENDGISYEEIAVLLRTNYRVDEFAKGFSAKGVPYQIEADRYSDLSDEGRRPESGSQQGGVHLMTYHDAKGLEFDAVFLPRLVAGEIPFQARLAEAPEDEERRLFYVGMTRARTHLFLTRPSGRPSRFLLELAEPTVLRRRYAPPVQPKPRSEDDEISLSGTLLDVLKGWYGVVQRRRTSFLLMRDQELVAIAEAAPTSVDELRAALSNAPEKAERYSAELIRLVERKTQHDEHER